LAAQAAAGGGRARRRPCPRAPPPAAPSTPSPAGIVTARYMASMTPCSVWGRNMLGMVSEDFI